MNKSELKKVLRPLIKECIKEVIFEEGVLANIVSEVAQGLGGQTLVETKAVIKPLARQKGNNSKQEQTRVKQKLQETRKKMLEAIGTDAYNGVDVFAGTTPTSSPSESQQGSPLNGVDPGDSGVDINKLFGGTSKSWSGITK
jgi:flagellin-like hook-associated protein FlgL|tara:strand:+ start:159 stop:584 length:426 start_codon:yes stop_codon:yes gene_type:complete